jgi:hypothetical protein
MDKSSQVLSALRANETVGKSDKDNSPPGQHISAIASLEFMQLSAFGPLGGSMFPCHMFSCLLGSLEPLTTSLLVHPWQPSMLMRSK